MPHVWFQPGSDFAETVILSGTLPTFPKTALMETAECNNSWNSNLIFVFFFFLNKKQKFSSTIVYQLNISRKSLKLELMSWILTLDSLQSKPVAFPATSTYGRLTGCIPL